VTSCDSGGVIQVALCVLWSGELVGRQQWGGRQRWRRHTTVHSCYYYYYFP